MATLRELYDIEAESKGALNPDPLVMDAPNLRARLKIAARVHARTLLNGGTLEMPGGGNIPSTGKPVYPDPDNGDEKNNAIAFAQAVVSAPETAVDNLMGLALAGAKQLSEQQILERTDQQLEDGIIPLIPMLAKGRHPGR